MKRAISSVMALAMLVSLAVGIPPAVAATSSGIDPAMFANVTDFQYRPGVRWWWPGNAASTADLIAQVDYLAENGFGMVEIAGFTNGFLPATNPEATATNSNISHATPGYDLDAILSYGSLDYYKKLEAVVERCNYHGIVVDLNMGSGYLANDFSLDFEDSQAHMALGRATITAANTNPIADIEVPAVEASVFYGAKIQGSLAGEWKPDSAKLCAVIVAQITNANAAALSSPRNRMLDFSNPTAPTFLKTYAQRQTLDFDNAVVYEASQLANGKIPSFTPSAAADYEVIALYSIPNGSVALNSIRENADGKRAYVVDHLNAAAVERYIDGWFGNPGLDKIVENYSIRAAFNDSYEFWMDRYFNERVYQLAKQEAQPGGLLGYDITKYIPSFYGVLSNSFTMSGNGGLGFYYDSLTGWGTTAVQFFNTVDSRITYDYNQLINIAFQEGMKAFSDTLGKYDADGTGILYRQQAYNPPIDTLKASKFVDIPEGEQENETSLRRVASGAHLYGKNLVTAEEFTLGNVPFNVTPQKMKLSYDLFAISGVNNIFYHGLNAPYYGGKTEMEDGLFPEEGWRGWSTIGVEMADTEVIAPYYNTMNMYTARANYVMQAGKPSSDVALYMPLFGSISANAPVVTMNRNGLTWDAINDDTITDDLRWNGAKLTNGIMDYSALIVNNATVPVKTMQALRTLAEAGAPIIFTTLPNAQPSFCGGNYAAQNALVGTLASEALAAGAAQITVSGSTYSDDLAAKLLSVCKPGINYNPLSTDDVRLNRRTLETGGELAYIRNSSTSAAHFVTLKVDPSLTNAYWLDQSNGKIYNAEVANGSVNITLKPVGAIILLCEPDGAAMPAYAISKGLPASIEQYAVLSAKTLTDSDFTLTVTADNFNTSGGTTAGVVPGADETRVLTGAVLGSWTTAGFQNNLLRYVSSPGAYTTKVQIDSLDDYAKNRMVLDLGTVNSAATVAVNGEVIGQLFYAPYQIDITSALKQGENEIKIEVQPLKHNRRVGLQQAYNSDKAANKRYMYYAGNVSGGAVAAGLVGPVNLLTVENRYDIAVQASIRSDEAAVVVGAPVSYSVSLADAKGAGIVTLRFEANGNYLDINAATALNGFTVLSPLSWEYKGPGGVLEGSIRLMCPGFVNSNNPLDILKISGTACDLLGETTVTITGLTVTGNVDGFSGPMPSQIKAANATTSIVSRAPVYSKYDLNRDGKIDESDLAIAVFYYLKTDLDPDWEEVKFDRASAKDCDVAVNGRVDLADLIEIMANYCDSYDLFP